MQRTMTRPDVARVIRAATSWPGVVTDATTPGITELHLGPREIGHLHGENVGHLPLPPHVRDEALASGAAAPHPMFPNANWVEIVVDSDHAADDLIRLLRLNYDRFRAQQLVHDIPAEAKP